MTDILHPQVAAMAHRYRLDLRHTRPSDDLDARIGYLVAGLCSKSASPRRPAHVSRSGAWMAAAGIAVLAINLGILIGIRLERGTRLARVPQAFVGPPLNFSMWPSDSVALQIPAEYSRGALVAVDSQAAASGKRYWVDVVVSNDGTVRIDQIVPVDSKSGNQGSRDGITLQKP